MKTPGGIVFKMLRLNKFFIFLIPLVLFFSINKGKAESIKFLFVEEKKPKTLFLFSGRASLLSLPCQITKALVGSPNDIKVEIDKLNKKEVHILLKKWRSSPSNLILKCKDMVFIFDLIPSKNTHYDYVKVLRHIPYKPFEIKSVLPNNPSTYTEGLKEKDYEIRKILDFSWEGYTK